MPKAVPVRSRKQADPIYSKYVREYHDSCNYRRRGKSSKTHEADSGDEGVVPEDLTKKILAVAREQLLEDEGDGDFGHDAYSEASEAEEDVPESGDYIEADEDYEEEDEDMQQQYARKNFKSVDDDERLHAHDHSEQYHSELPPEVIEHYTRIGKFLSVYTVGKIPKGFKILPTRKQWEELLYYTNPVEWTPHAHYQATKIFASNLNDNLAQRYFNLVLLPAIRADIKEHKKLHFQLYQSLKKALFKPLAFMKGILLPLCDSPDCTLREAVIVGSVVAKMTIPMAFGAAALFKLCVKSSDWTPVKSIMITILLNKKYSLPSSVIEGLTVHFSSFVDMEVSVSKMPVLWHASLLTFVQRYKESIQENQRERLLSLLSVHSHYQITPEIRRELTCMDM